MAGLILSIAVLAALAVLTTPTMAEGDAFSVYYYYCGDSTLKNLHPNETVARMFFVENTCNRTDTYILEFTVENPLWIGRLDVYRLDGLPPGRKEPFNLTLMAPARGEVGDSTNASLVVKSTISDESREIAWTAQLLIERDVHVYCDVPLMDGMSGERVQYDLVVMNTGDVTDGYTMEGVMGSEDPWWSITFYPPMVTLDPGHKAHVTAFVDIPVVQTGRYLIHVRARSDTECKTVDIVFLHCWVRYVFTASLVPTSGKLTVMPGVMNPIHLGLVQTTDSPRTYIWQLDTSCSDPDWCIVSPWTQRNLSRSVELGIAILVAPPPDARPGKTAALTVVLRLQAFPTPVLTSTLKLVSTERHLIEISPALDVYKVLPGKHLRAAVLVNNLGNMQEMCEVYAQPPQGWTMIFPWTCTVVGWCMVVPRASSEVQLDMEVARFTAPGRHTVTVSLVVVGRETLTCDVLVDVGELHAVSVEGPPDDGRGLQADGWRAFALTLENLGNTEEELVLQATIDSEQCNVTVEADRFTLPPGATRSARLNLSASSQVDFGSVRATVTATSLGGSILGELELLFDVMGPDLTVTSVAPPDDAVGDRPMTLKVTVKNVGWGFAAPSRVVVRDMDSGSEVGPFDVPSLRQGETVTLNLSLVAPGGWSRYLVVVNDDCAVREDGKASNTAELSVHARERKDPGSWSTVHPDIPHVGVFVVLVLLLLVTRKRFVSR